MSADLNFNIPAWMEDAGCTTTNPEWFFKEDAVSIGITKAVCQPCGVRLKCLQHALQNDEEGVWGGTTAAERRAMRVAAQ